MEVSYLKIDTNAKLHGFYHTITVKGCYLKRYYTVFVMVRAEARNVKRPIKTR